MKQYVLLVDSNQAFRGRVTAMLRDRGYAVYESGDLSRADDLLERERIDLVCIDAVVSGAATAEFINRRIRGRADCLVAYVVHPAGGDGDAMPSDVPVDLLLNRPISAEELVYKLDTRLKLKMLDEHDSDHLDLNVPSPPQTGQGAPDTESRRALQERYGAKVPMRFAEIGALLVAASDKRDSLTELQEAHRLAHMLNGTAGSIGFSDVSSAVHALESALKEMLRMRRLTSVPGRPPYREDGACDGTTGPSVGEPGSLLATVLVVDDDPEFLVTVNAMAKENLIKVVTASNGEGAVRAARETRVDAAILDIILSEGEDAYLIARQLRSLPGYQGLPLGFISVDSSISQRIAAAHAGAALFIKKPLQNSEFLAAVRRLVPVEGVSRSKILVVDDDPDFLGHMTNLLEAEGLDVVTLESATNIVEEMGSIRPDMVLLDVVMDNVNGLDACRVLRSTETWRDIPILMLTVYGNRKMLVQCFQAGADDYIEKPIIREELLARIRLRLERIQMYRERADTDALTGLPTRRPFIELLKMRIAEGVRFNKPVSLCLLDLDDFKRINDSFGHLAGDRVLAALGLLLSSRFRTMDVRGRWGGEEFVVAFFGEDAETARMIVGRVLDEFRKMTFKGDHGEVFTVTFSAGVASFPSAGNSIEELFRTVDMALYRAKDLGKDRIELG